MNEFGTEFKALRLLKGLNSVDLSKEVGKAQTYVSQLERGIIRNPNPTTLHALIEIMKLNQLEKLSLLSKLPHNHVLSEGTIFTPDYCEEVASRVFNEIKSYPFEVQKRLLKKIVNNL